MSEHQMKTWDDSDLESMRYRLGIKEDQVDLAFENGAAIWIEREAGRIRVHCYRPHFDLPVNVEIYDERIEVDRDDYDAEGGDA